MPDTDRPRIATPGDWNQAFAALPLESPGNDGWQRLTRALDDAATGPAVHSAARPHTAARRRARWPVWLAVAAAVSAVALIPLLRQGEAPVQSGATRVADDTTHAPSPSRSAPTPAASDAPSVIAPSATSPAVVATTKAPERTAARRKPVGMPTRKPAPVASPLPARSDNGTRVADAGTTPPAPAIAAGQDTATTAPSATSLADGAVAIQALQTESAQLEALVTLARDERVSSASGAALGVELDERIGRIDASLSQPGLADSDRVGLWQQRVEAMRELAGIETTQRWLVTRGERYDGALVNVD
ncbi:hypothetical protein MNR01_07445 [Lysobacter sp. S4-A87]|uniref:hypothetical protein n=1 Tax=Lysobacter sp. S4-A87 TaxID=2925843 RepID=UPI001F53199F|nr:hypothetical protein [Lysobacter sp. S4-A87]UNK50826.1 hypothetical protein MNR01_07445 [Lysobacter sp. S4-A87]